MKRLLLTTVAVLGIVVGGGYAYKAVADTADPLGAGPPGAGTQAAGPPAAESADAGSQDFGPPGAGSTDTGAGPPGPFAGNWGHDGGPGDPGGPGRMHHHEDKFSLFAHVPDKNLSPADVKVIAAAILLEHGNHDWTVTDVAAQSDKSIDFSFASTHGDVIARFAVDPASGHIKRIT